MKICIYILTSRKNSEHQCSDDLCVQITYEVIFFLLPLELYFVTSLMVDIKKKKKRKYSLSEEEARLLQCRNPPKSVRFSSKYSL